MTLPFTEAELREMLAKEVEATGNPNWAAMIRDGSGTLVCTTAEVLAAMSAIAREAHNRAVEECIDELEEFHDIWFHAGSADKAVVATYLQDAIRALKLPEGGG